MAGEILSHDAELFLQCRLLIAHPSRPQILTVHYSRNWSLPELTPLEQHVAAVDHINAAAYRLFGLNTYVRRLISEAPGDPDFNELVRYYELEVVGELARQRISRTAWAGRTVMDEMTFKPGPDRDTIKSWLMEFESGKNPERRASWSRPGWFESAASWMKHNATGPDSLTQAIPGQQWSDDRQVILASPSDSGIVIMMANAPGTTTQQPDPVEWASRFGWNDMELITNDAARNWSLYRANVRAASVS
jgi:hypothetical protein